MIRVFVSIWLICAAGFSYACDELNYAVGTGSKGAVFYPTIKAICDNFNNKSHSYKCHAIVSAGAQDNLEQLIIGEKEMAVSQYALQHEYYNKNDNIRTVMQLHSEYFTVLVREDLDIKSIKDLQNIKVNIGNSGSGSRIFFEKIIASLGINLNDFTNYFEAKSSDIDDLFCSKEIDAAVYLVGHPNKIFNKAIKRCNGKLLALPADEIKQILAQNPNFTSGHIKANTYSNTEDISTVAMPIILSTRNDTSVDFIYQLLKITSQDLEKLRKKNPVFEDINLTIDKDIANKIAPLHKGAKIFFD